MLYNKLTISLMVNYIFVHALWEDSSPATPLLCILTNWFSQVVNISGIKTTFRLGVPAEEAR